MATTRSIAERKRMKDDLTARTRQQAAIADLAARVAEGGDPVVLIEHAVAAVASALPADYCEIVERLPNSRVLRNCAGHGWPAGQIGSTVDVGNADSAAAYALACGQDVQIEDLRAERRFDTRRLLECRAAGAVAVLITGHDGPSAALAAYTTAARRTFSSGDVQFLRVVADLIGAAVARRRAEERASVLIEIAREISGTLDLRELLERVQWRTASVLGCEVVATFCWDPHRQSMCLVSHYGSGPDLYSEADTIAFRPAPALETHLATGQALVVNDVADQRWFPPELVSRFRAAALVAAPISVPGRDFGALVAFSGGDRGFDPGQAQLCEGIARQLAVGMEAIELYQNRQEEAVVSGALARVGKELIATLETPALLDRLCRLTAEVLGADCSHTFLLHSDEDAFLCVAGHGDGGAQREAMRARRLSRTALPAALEHELVVQLGGPEELRDLAGSGFTVVLFMALRVGAKLFGVQTAAYRGRQQAFSPQQVRTALGIAQLASTAIEYARVVEELERVNRMKSDFVATMSHELRTPLHVIIGYNDLMLEHAFGPLSSEQEETLRKVSERTRELLGLLTATLNLTRLEAMGNPENVDVAGLALELDAEMRPARERSGVRFTWKVAADLPPLYTDRAKLKIVLEQLIDNAFRFTDDGMVAVEIAPRDSGMEFRVSDTGVGIDPEVLPRIFEPFRGADSSMSPRGAGTGLGLYTVRRVLDMLGGTISAVSEPGSGTTFRVWLPPVPRRRARPPHGA